MASGVGGGQFEGESFVGWSQGSQRGILFLSLKQTWSVLLIHYYNHVLFGKSSLNSLTVEEFTIAEGLIKKLTILSTSESIARRREKRKRDSSTPPS